MPTAARPMSVIMEGLPRRIPDELHHGVLDSRDPEQGPLRPLRDAFAHRTAGRGEGHLHRDARCRVMAMS